MEVQTFSSIQDRTSVKHGGSRRYDFIASMEQVCHSFLSGIGRSLTVWALTFLISVATGVCEGLQPSWRTTIAFGSCTDIPSSPIWNSIGQIKPDALVLLGDNIYLVDPEWQQIEKIRKRYAALRNDPGFSSLAANVSVYASWDDHDFGPNNADSTFRFKVNTLTAFREMFLKNPKPPVGLEDGIAFEVRIGEGLLLATDNRTYRVNSGGRQKPVMFGERQLQWIEERMKQPNAKVVFLSSGNEVLPNQGGTQTMYPYSEERARLWSAIENSPVPVIILSGDRHYGQIMIGKIGEKTVMEASSSPLTAKPRNQISKLIFSEEVQRVSSVGGDNNFGVVTVEGLSNGTIVAQGEIHLVDGFVAGRARAVW